LEGTNSIHVAVDMDCWQGLVNTVMNVRVTYKAQISWLPEGLSVSQVRVNAMELVW
jgi:hypothetical protein